MKDPEFIEMRNKFLLGLIIALIFSIPVFFIFKNKLVVNNELENKISKNKEVVLYINSNDCINCKKVKKYLDNNKIKYYTLGTSSNKYKSIMNKIGVNEKKIIAPAIIYIEESELKAYIVNVNSKNEVNKFLETYNIK